MSKRLIDRQLKALNLSAEQPPADPAVWAAFLEKVSRTYADSDQERYLLERSLQISSREMQEQWRTIEAERARSIQAGKLATLGEMAGGIAHEINNPLSIIHLNAEIILETLDVKPRSDHDLKKCAATISRTAMRISKIINGLRTFARMGDSDPFLPSSIEEIIDEAIALSGAALKSNEIELRWNKPDRPVMVQCRSTQISQVILNLLSNSRDAISLQPGGKWIAVEVKDSGDQAEVIVTDSGKGIPEEIREKIMEPFFTTKEVGKGTGLGLSVSKGIMEQHNGRLLLDPGSPNTCFVLVLPKLQNPQKAAA